MNFSKLFDLPLEITHNLVRAELIGFKLARIENHCGIISFSSEEIRFNLLKNEHLVISGDNLIIKKLQPTLALVEGNIREIVKEN